MEEEAECLGATSAWGREALWIGVGVVGVGLLATAAMRVMLDAHTPPALCASPCLAHHSMHLLPPAGGHSLLLPLCPGKRAVD